MITCIIYWLIWPRFTYKNYMINFTSLNYNWNWIFKNTMKTHTMYIPSMASRWSMKKGRWGGGELPIHYDNLMFEGFWSVTRSHISPFYERNWSETTCILYWFRKMKRSKYTCSHNINFIGLSLFGFFREINSDTNSNTWIFAYKFHKNVRENVKTARYFFFKFSSLYLVCGTCIDHALTQKIYLDL